MIDHNNEEYFKAIRRMDRLGLFCWSKSFVAIALSMEEQNDEKEDVNSTPEVKNTKDVNIADVGAPRQLTSNTTIGVSAFTATRSDNATI